MTRKHLANQAKSLLHLIKYRLQKKHAPLFTALAVTNRCNYQCTYCYGDYYHQKHENFSTTELLQIIDDLSKMGARIINLIGGEPLLRDDIDLLAKRVKKNGMICTISSNLSLLPEKIDKLRGIDIDSIDTSLDGLEEGNDKNRGKGTFQKTFKGIKCAIENNIKTNVNMVLTKYNLADVEPMIKLAADTGFALSFNVVYESHSYEYKNYQDSFNIKNKDDKAIKDILEKIISYKEKGYPVRFSKAAYKYTRDWPCSYGGKVYITDKTKPKDFKPIKCYHPQFFCYIDSDGRMYDCLHLKDIAPVINVKELGTKKAWEKVSSFKPPCIACYSICNNDSNMIFGLKLRNLFSTAKDLLFAKNKN